MASALRLALNQQFSDHRPVRDGQEGSWDHDLPPSLLEARDCVLYRYCSTRMHIAWPHPPSWAATTTKVPFLFAFCSSPLPGSGQASTPYQPCQQAPVGTHGWGSCCHLASPTAGQLPEEHASAFIHPHLPKTNNTTPQKSPSWAVWSTRPVCWAGGRQETSRSSHFSQCCWSATSL